MKQTLLIATIILSALPLSQPASATAGPRYAVIIVRDLEGKIDTSTTGINLNGDLVGSSFGLPQGGFHPTRWIDGEILDLNPDLPGNGFAVRINDVGQIVGHAEFEGLFLKHRGFLWEDGKMIDLGTLGGELSEARAINDLGQVVGWAAFEMTSGRHRPFLWQDGVMSLLGPSCDECSGSADDINNSGHVVGTATTPDFFGHAVVWNTDGTMTELPLFGAFSRAHGINDRGQMVGFSGTSTFRAVLWEDGEIIALDPGNFFGSVAQSINNNGIIVGVNFEGRDHGALWDAQHRQHNLSYEIAPLNRWWVRRAEDINDHGQIAVTVNSRQKGSIANSPGAILTPVNPTFKLFEPKPGIAGQINTITARGGNLEPGSVVNFYWGVRGGGTRIVDCNMLDAVLQIENARPAGSAIADADGIATLEGFLPNEASGKNILFQAVTGPNTPTGCAQSQVIVVHFD